MKKGSLRVVVLILTLFISKTFFGQELNIGLEFTGGPRASEARVVSVGPIIEYRPVKSLVSINSGIILYVYKNESLVTIPLSLKFIIGNTIRFCPSIGGFLRTNKNFGYSAGLVIDYEIKKRLFLFLKGEFNQDYWKENSYSHFGGTGEITKSGYSYWIGIGIKKNIL